MPIEGAGYILPGAVRQNGYVVRDFDRAIESWLALGVGPWFTMRSLKQSGSFYRGAVSEPVLSIGFANSGGLQIELIHQEDDTPSVYREFIDSGREGFHHLAWWAEDYDRVVAAARAAGWSVVQAGDGGGSARFSYFEVGPLSPMVEVMELNAATRPLGDAVRDAAVGWDGSEPRVRRLR